MTALIITLARREDRALLGSNPSARPGAEACREAADPRLPCQPRPISPICFGSNALNPPCRSRNATVSRATDVTIVNIYRAELKNDL
jgi:hypothetical protein